ncbi:putative bifunctional inhibitor/plant lipid transfer protein/seed storage helical domain superfamily [Helianthus annuus]|nr:putative bifunctional inhibitor/plant lipid transfer protein/seed storage helical domain superfamily [Helianthus annuus]
MIRSTILKAVIFVFVLFLHPHTEGQVVPIVPLTPFAPRPLCNYQMALANQACAYLPFVQIPPPAPRAPYDPPAPPSDDEDTPEPEHMDLHAHRHVHNEDHDNDTDADNDNGNDHDHNHDHDRDHGHKRGHGRKQQRQHPHHHRHHHRHRATPVEEQCCKWLSQVDDQCVCELLLHMPPFLARPVHRYSVIVGKACNITYSCGSRIRN